jgi:thiol-disulfide isomerase/thioredoxin
MRTLLLLLLLSTALVPNAASQSGRRISAPRTTSTAPIQPPLTPEPEPPTTTAASGDFLLLTESFREREIKSLDNGTFKLADFRGKVIVVNVWASWCGPCRREIPEYEKVRKAYSTQDVEFIGLTTEDPRTSSDRVNRFVRDTHFGFRLGWADRETARTLMNGQNSIPQTLVIDADGRVVKHWSGYSPGRSAQRLTEIIELASKK